MSTPTRALAIAAGLVIVALTAAAFWLSYAHLAEVALAHGMQDKEIRAWAWPATLDLFIVAGELLMLRAALTGKVDWWAIGLTVVGSGSSIALNVAGVGSHADPLDYVVAAVPPTAALLAFGALMRQIHQALAARSAEPVTVAEVTMERLDADQPAPPALTTRPMPEVVPASARMLPLVARPEPSEEPDEVVMPPMPPLEFHPIVWPPQVTTLPRPQTTASVPAETTREVVTEVIALTPAELRRKARSLNRQAVRSTNRPVTIKELQDTFGLSRREATELRREALSDRS